jgi:integrase
MASVTQEKRGGRTRYRICWRDGDKRRKSLRLSGDIGNKKDADAIARKVTAIVSANASKRTLANAVAQWLAEIGDDLHGKLAESGLVEPRQSAKLGEFLSGYIDARKSEVEPRTIVSFEATKAKLIEHFTEPYSLRAISDAEAHTWRQSLFATLSPTTIAGHIKRAKQFFTHAKRMRLIESNPFAELVAGSQANDSRLLFIDRAMIDSVIEYAPDAEWRLLIALARYGGLRNPSETLRLRWQDINWAEKRILVTCEKTKRHKPFRTIPLFPELEPYLLDAQELASEGAVYCIERHRSQDKNLRTGLQRIIAKAGLTPWPRLWQNLRASRETELANEYPIHVVTEWIGNPPKVAAKHYLSVTDDHFAQATKGVAQGVETSLPETIDLDGNDSQRLKEQTQRKQGSLAIVGLADFDLVGRAGLEPATKGL